VDTCIYNWTITVKVLKNPEEMKQNASFSIYHLINALHPDEHEVGNPLYWCCISFDVWKEAFHHSDKTC